ncbi:MAG: LysM peptidoglycan-binding domain-containing protein [Proteobacteria bacterium]|nr:LysM peptidoglycan-binding domain-containing protein [Pseudomonadota bacterium]
MSRNVRIISLLLLTYSSLLLGLTSLPASAEPAQGQTIELADGAPDRHIVVPGDTLWGISTRFLKQPYRWPEIWRLNQEQIKNPQRIYPGQVVILDQSGSQPQLKLANVVVDTVKASPRVYSEDNRREIPSIPQQAIEPFLSEPLVAEVGQLDKAPRIVATQEDRVYLGKGDLAYVTGVGQKAKLWQIYRPGKALIDPDSQETLGYETFYLGTARMVREGEPSTFEVIASRQEIGRGDRLLPAPPADIISYVPHAPGKPLKGRIVSVYGGVGQAGRDSIVTLSRGLRDGVEIGHVLSLLRAGSQVVNWHEGKKEVYQLPDERYGLLFVFRVFDRVSYALVMNVTRSVEIGDVVTAP